MFLARLIKALKEAKLEYAIAGGLAVALHGAVRGTVDIDLLVVLDERSLTQLESALLSLGLVSRIPVSASEIFRFKEEYIKQRNLKAWNFVNPNVPTELVDVMIIYDLREFKIETKRAAFGEVKVISLEDLIRMKKEAGRAQDLADVEALSKIQDH